MNESTPSSTEPGPSAAPRTARPRPQISLGFMMLMMVIFAVMSAALLYGSRVPAVQEEIDILFDGNAGSSGNSGGRVPHIIFIMFTFTSPLLLAGTLATGLGVLRWFHRRGA